MLSMTMSKGLVCAPTALLPFVRPLPSSRLCAHCPPPLGIQILSMDKCFVCVPAPSPHLFACSEYTPSSHELPTSFPTPSITRSCVSPSPPSLPSSYIHPQHYRSRPPPSLPLHLVSPHFYLSSKLHAAVKSHGRHDTLASGLCSRLLL
jgi:hypothetical protein